MKEALGSRHWRRAAAFGIDTLGFALMAWVVCRSIDHSVKVAFPPHQAAKAAARMVPTLLLLYAAWVAVPMAVWQASIGKKLLGLRVVRARDGQPLELPVMIIRELAAKWVSLIMNGAGLIDGLITGIAFHDRLVGSQVISVDAPFEASDDQPRWPAVRWSGVITVAVVTLFIYWSVRTNGFVYRALWSGAFYVPHEAGHLVVGMVFPHLIGVAAGAWGQLLFPSIAAVVFARRRWPVQLAGALVWLAFSLFDIGQYAGDAWYRELALPVAAGDDLTEDHLESHDWWQLLTAAGVLRYAQPVGEAISSLGWLTAGLGAGLLLALARRRA